ncbi:hypothetical protein C8T65DRAFT_726765, partial [Cerioporus squamosus]
MSSDADAAAATLAQFNTVALFDTLYTYNCCAVAACVLFIYDSFVTFDREVACFWTAKRTGASLLFFVNKWITMILYVIGVVGIGATFLSDKRLVRRRTWQTSKYSLRNAYRYPQLFLVLNDVARNGGIAVCCRGMSKPLGLLVFALSLAPVGANLVFYGYQLSGVTFPSFGCITTDNTTAALELRFVFISRVPLITADMLLIYITSTKLSSWSAMRDIRHSKRLSLSDVLFCGGIIYFVVLVLLSVLHLVFSTTAVVSDVEEGSYVTVFTMPITAILISRFLLELQEANQVVVRLDPDDPLHSSRNAYDSSSFISSLGGFNIRTYRCHPMRTLSCTLVLAQRPGRREVGQRL